MLSKDKIIEIARKNGKLFTRDLVNKFKVSRQYANSLIGELVTEGKLIKLGSTRKAYYVLPEYLKKNKDILPIYKKSFKNISLEEHIIKNQVEEAYPLLKRLPENIKSIFEYAFSEMVNNAIEHSKSPRINIEVSVQKNTLTFEVSDSGIGVFRNIMKKKKLKSELEAIQELMKGKVTTMPKSHSGEGIFFTSKSGDLFILESFGFELMIDNRIQDIFVKENQKVKKGTKVTFKINTSSNKHLSEVFEKYTNKDSDYGFDKTEIQIKLYTIGGVHISRSQARRILSGLDKFKVIVFDFDKVSVVGQAFADEIFRVFHNKYPNIILEAINMNKSVKFMVERAKNEAMK